jgi:hypothetical protein
MSTRRALRRSIESFSRSLGPNAGSVASTLTQLNVHGVPRDSTRCALARYLSAIITTERSVSTVAVTDRSIHVKRGRGRLPIIVYLPQPVRAFIRAFDNGCYPQLIGQEQERCDSLVPGGHSGPSTYQEPETSSEDSGR